VTTKPVADGSDPTTDAPADAFGALLASLVGPAPTDPTDSADATATATATTDVVLAAVVESAVPVVAAPPEAELVDPGAESTDADAIEEIGAPAVENAPAEDAPTPIVEVRTEADAPTIDGVDQHATATPASNEHATLEVVEPARPVEHRESNEVTPPTRFETAPVRVQTATPTERPASAAPSAPEVPAAVDQVVHAVRGMSNHKEGVHRVQLELSPPELGHVHVEMRIERGEVHLHVTADDPITAATLQQHMGDLRNDLESRGLRAGTLDVGGAPQRFARDDDATSHDGPDDAPRDDAVTAIGGFGGDTATSPTITSDIVDVRI
jgi:flagellar hook-length control protein FliK